MHEPQENTQLKEQAREKAKLALAASASFQQLNQEEQYQLYRKTVEDEYQQLAQQQGLSTGMRRRRGTGGASDLINEDRHSDDNLDKNGDRFGDFINKVNFPKFVEDLLEGVFDANLNVTLKQMNTYQDLLKTATASVAKFINEIDDTAAFGYLAENNSDEFSLSFPDIDGDGGGGSMNGDIILTDKDGNPVDTKDAKIKAKIMDSKIQMAREQRSMLRETLLMGISRLVIEEGNVKASVLFDIKSKNTTTRTDNARKSRQRAMTVRKGNGIFRFLSPIRGQAKTNTTEVSVSTTNSVQQTEMAAKLAGSVDIKFKSDYFKLDNFADIMKEEVKNQAPGAAAKPEGQAPQG